MRPANVAKVMKPQNPAGTLSAGRTLLLVLAWFFVTGCVAPEPTFQTKKDPAYEGKLEKVLIVSENEELAGRLGPDFSRRLLERFAAALAQKGVTSEIVHTNNEDLDPSAPVKAAADRFLPRQIFYIGVIQVQTQSQSSAIQGPLFAPDKSVAMSIGCRIADRQSGKTVWAGKLQANPPQPPEKIADHLVNQLEAERLL